jgi:SAM-dependent methyltransferase
MKQTPAHNVVNHELLSFIPANCRRVVEIGCMHGALAHAYRAVNSNAEYIGIDIDPDYAKVAERQCTKTIAGNIEELKLSVFNSLFPSDCWIFGDCLEHLRDPWALLRRIHDLIDPDGCLLACIPNAQNWNVQMRLATGKFFYEDSGLLDRTHIRWFTRITIIEMFQSTGWKVENAISRNISSPNQEKYLSAIAAMAQVAGFDPTIAVQDATPFQYVFKVIPA